ncbi:hypothetical protein CATRI_02060 [Corynebacterium atrinae]|uniref:hypothetical protein n=1 Tax=Corynebacterium atrinae TaxID=1336740 RepID=UPI0025B3FFD9|nr:hypothetical protein [Corynebacterium atrinae]WJY62517.1 hypothetical protein CATRI_02060 [Corynebacterium atrinae]
MLPQRLSAALPENGRAIRAFLIAGIISATALGLSACDDKLSSALSSSGSSSESSEAVEPSLDPAETPTSAVETSTLVAPTPTTPEGIDRELVEKTLQTSWSSFEDPEAALDMSALLTGVALEDFENQRQEWAVTELHQVGRAEIVSTDIEPTDDPTAVVARVCVDSSGVEVRDENDNVVNADIPREEQRSLMLTTFRLEDGTWKMAERAFPDDPRC